MKLGVWRFQKLAGRTIPNRFNGGRSSSIWPNSNGIAALSRSEPPSIPRPGAELGAMIPTIFPHHTAALKFSYQYIRIYKYTYTWNHSVQSLSLARGSWGPPVDFPFPSKVHTSHHKYLDLHDHVRMCLVYTLAGTRFLLIRPGFLIRLCVKKIAIDLDRSRTLIRGAGNIRCSLYSSSFGGVLSLRRTKLDL